MAPPARPLSTPSGSPAPLPVPLAAPATSRRRRPTWVYVFGGIFALMMIAGFEVGFLAGSPKQKAASSKPTAVASARKTTVTTTVPAEPEPKGSAAKTAEPPPTEPPMPEPKKVEPTPPEPKKAEPPEPKKTETPEPKPVAKAEPKVEPKKTPEPNKGGPEVTFAAKIVGIFKDKCTICHGGVEPKGGIDLRSAKASIMGGDSGVGLVAGDPENSVIWQRILDPDKPMPPKNKPQLTAEEKKLIKDWIAGGAK